MAHTPTIGFAPRYCLRGGAPEMERSWILAAGDNLLGSSATNDLVLPIAGVSRRHARLRIGEQGMELEDLRSTNGSFVNGKRVDKASLRPGDTIRLGPATLTLHQVDPGDVELALGLRPPTRPAPLGLTDEKSTYDLLAGPPEPRSSLVDPRGRLPELLFPEGFVPGTAPASAALYHEMRQLCRSELPLLIAGETGVGKEHVARTLHASSKRGEGPFLAINCASIPSELLEAELFGITEGAASGVRGRPGIFQQARQGTLLLDEIGEMSLDLQAKVLRALQGKEVQPVGGRPQPIDVRILAATNKDLRREVETGRFRRDLYYRVAGATLTVPPLRERREDVPALVARILEVAAAAAGKTIRGVTVKAMSALVHYPWPGNVRELENEIQRLVHRCANGQAIDSTMLPEPMRQQAAAAADAEPEAAGSLRLDGHVLDLERRLITLALERTGGSRRRAAVALGISRNALARKMKRLGLA